MLRTTTRLAAALLISLTVGCDDGDSSAAPEPDGSTASDATLSVDSAMGDARPADAAADDAGPPDETVADEIASQIDLTQYATQLEFVAKPRTPGSAQWQLVQDRCADVFAEAGFEVERHAYQGGVNVVGVLPGTDKPEEVVVLSAHYDHIAECTGADDNASGVAGVLEAARVLKDQTFERTIVLACWDEEEWGLLGSRAWTDRIVRQTATVQTSIVLEMIGYSTDLPNSQTMPRGFGALFPDLAAFIEARDGRGDFIVAVADDINPGALNDFTRRADAVGLAVGPAVLNDLLRVEPALGDLRRSDHDSFWAHGLPGIMLTDSANFRNPNYHCAAGQDDIADLDLVFATQIVESAVFAVAMQAVPSTGTPGEVDLVSDPDVPPAAVCSLLEQDCGPGKKCVGKNIEGTVQISCVDEAPTDVATGEICVRPADIPGEDTCQAGNYCAFFGQGASEPQQRICARLCSDGTDCEAGSSCLRLYNQPRVGGCSLDCDPRVLDACPNGRCEAVNLADRSGAAFTCMPYAYGEGAEGAPCEPQQCGAGLVCVSNEAGSVCAQWCETSETCPEGHRCDPIPGRPLGGCFPPAE